jgi:class 3 adenylate cyclase
MKQLPTGMLTFMFTDVVGSTRLWEIDRVDMSRAMATHDLILVSQDQPQRTIPIREVERLKH